MFKILAGDASALIGIAPASRIPAVSLAAILAVAVLLLLPGGLMLLVPWSLRPFLSLAFWIASWWWLPRLGPGRTPFLHGAILAFALLGLTRFLKPIQLRRPSLPASLVGLAMALTFLGPSLASRLLPAEAAFDALTARLLVARDGIPETYEPLLPVRAFGLRPPGFASLAADVGLLAGASPRQALPVTAGVAQALLLLAAFRLLRRFLAGVPAALAAIGFGLVASALGVLPAGAVLGLALALVAAPHLGVGPKAPAVAAGVFLVQR